MSVETNVTALVADFRKRVEIAWNDDTAAPAYRPLPPHFPESYGQCKPTSYLLLQELAHEFSQQKFFMAHGRVFCHTIGNAALQPAIRSHFWIHWPREGKLAEASAIDATGDQAAHTSLPPYFVTSYDELHKKGIYYFPLKQYTARDCRTHAFDKDAEDWKRVELLQARLALKHMQ